MSSTTNLLVLRIEARTWTRDSHGLFDYETTDYLHTSCFIDNTTQLHRHKTDGKVSECKEANTESQTALLLTVNKTNDGYSIANKFQPKSYPTPEIANEMIDRFWYVLNSIVPTPEANEDYVLNPNDIIKLGRIQYAISEYHINKPSRPEYKEQSFNIGYDNMKYGAIFDLIYQADRYEESKSEDKLCKICYSGDNEDMNPLVHLCACQGGIRFAHFNCLKIWMKTKECFKDNSSHNCSSYILKGFNCEICQQPYPFQFSIKGQSKVFALIDIKRPITEYIVLESLNQMKDNVNTKILHVIQLSQEKYIIGRGHDCDIRINDISVSRTHAILLYNKNTKKITIKDHKSKFGSLVLIKAPLVFAQKKILIQIGRTVIETYLVPSKNEDGSNVKVRNDIKKTIDVGFPDNNAQLINEKHEQGDILQTKNNQSIESDNDNVSN